MNKKEVVLFPLLAASAVVMGKNELPNILFCIADDASRESFRGIRRKKTVTLPL